ncbi:hypothetical protein ACFFGT_12200 [Mucilaginibacter angelicae]|uniref:Uncharacterized protein n=1 Tax=Mucilaginibacter angelicae TaxID=869718 RepID=A0ABV6L683_9SPHI
MYPELNEQISCKDLLFRNRAKLYWQFNCNKAWLTFKNPHGKSRIISLLNHDFFRLQGRLGYVGFTEYPSFFLAQHNVISGCCDPPIFYLHDKTTGKIRSELGSLVYFSKEYDTPVVIYTKEDRLVILNVETGKKHIIELPGRSIEQGLIHKKTLYAENLFTTKQQQEQLVIYFDYQDNKKLITHFDIDLKKY